MKESSVTDIERNWNELNHVIASSFSGERKEKILKLHDYFADRMALTPASGKEFYHNAFPGGYVNHVLGVIKAAKLLKEVWATMGCERNFTDEELIFSALFHDLGKVGDLENDQYIGQEDSWRRNKLKEMYTHNPKLEYMQVTDRTFWLLSQFDIKYSIKEAKAIRLADGLYEEYNKGYLMPYNEDYISKTNLIYIIHAADFMAMHSEYDEWKRSEVESGESEVDQKTKYQKKQTLADVAKTAAADSKLANFDDLFASFDKPKKNEGE